eukprot:symbB.v1.2.025822.t1/scaffold2533.1/size76754/3
MAKDGSVQAFLMDSLLGGVSDAVAKILWTAPIERARLVVQTQDANPKIRSGEVPRYTGIVDFAQRTLKEQDLSRSWDGNFTNCLRYFPTQAFNLAYKENLKKMLPKYNPKTELWQFFGANRVSDYARTRLASDVGSGKATFTGLGDCIVKTAKGPGGFFALYTGFGVSVYGINRGLQLGTFDTSTGLQQQQQMQDCFRKIAAEEGLMKGLYKRFVANLVCTVGAALVLESSKSFTVPFLSQDAKVTGKVGGYLCLHVDDADKFVSLQKGKTAMQQAVGNLAELGGITSKVDIVPWKHEKFGNVKVAYSVYLIEVSEASESAQSIAQKMLEQDIETVTAEVQSQLNAVGLNFTVRATSLSGTILPVNDLESAGSKVKEAAALLSNRGRSALKGTYRPIAPLLFDQLHRPGVDGRNNGPKKRRSGKEFETTWHWWCQLLRKAAEKDAGYRKEQDQHKERLERIDRSHDPRRQAVEQVRKHSRTGCAVVSMTDTRVRQAIVAEGNECTINGLKVQIKPHHNKETKEEVLTDLFVAWDRQVEKVNPLSEQMIAKYFDGKYKEIIAGWKAAEEERRHAEELEQQRAQEQQRQELVLKRTDEREATYQVWVRFNGRRKRLVYRPGLLVVVGSSLLSSSVPIGEKPEARRLCFL